MNIFEWYKKWKADLPIRMQKRNCRRGYHNWTDQPGHHIQCIDPGCGRYLR